MKGIVFNLLEQVVSRHHSEDVWDDLLDAAGLDGAYTSLGSYSDDELERLLVASSAKLGLPRAAVLRWFGQAAMPVLAETYPDFFKPHASVRPFILSINDVIHVEVRKLYSGAECPYFRLGETADGALTMGYQSSRNMCALAQGFVEGAATHYGEIVVFEHAQCTDHGDARCAFHISWPKLAAA
jgi:hypothetical protein